MQTIVHTAIEACKGWKGTRDVEVHLYAYDSEVVAIQDKVRNASVTPQ